MRKTNRQSHLEAISISSKFDSDGRSRGDIPESDTTTYIVTMHGSASISIHCIPHHRFLGNTLYVDVPDEKACRTPGLRGSVDEAVEPKEGQRETWRGGLTYRAGGLELVEGVGHGCVLLSFFPLPLSSTDMGYVCADGRVSFVLEGGRKAAVESYINEEASLIADKFAGKEGRKGVCDSQKA
jgi:hypothetical protein